jgi:hypothetical protein
LGERIFAVAYGGGLGSAFLGWFGKPKLKIAVAARAVPKMKNLDKIDVVQDGGAEPFGGGWKISPGVGQDLFKIR